MTQQIDHYGIAQILRDFRLKHQVPLCLMPLACQRLDDPDPRWGHYYMKTAILYYFAEVHRLAEAQSLDPSHAT